MPPVYEGNVMRRRAALSFLRQFPRSTAHEVAKHLGCSARTAATLLEDLRRHKGLVKKQRNEGRRPSIRGNVNLWEVE